MDPSIARVLMKDKIERTNGAMGIASMQKDKRERFYGAMGTHSPKSPFQFGHLLRNLSLLSYSASTTSSFETEYFDEDPQLGDGSPLNSPSFFDAYHTIDELYQTQSHLQPAMRKAHDLQVAIKQSHARVMGIANRVSLLNLAVAPLSVQSSKARRVEEHLARATEPAKASLCVFNSMHKLCSRLSAGPVDVGDYIEVLSKFQQRVRMAHKCAPAVVQALGEGVAFVNGSKLVESFHLEELYTVLETLQSLMVGQEHLVVSADIIDRTLETLIAAFGRIITDYCKPIELPNMPDITHQDSQNLKKSFMPAPLLQLLQGTAHSLACNNRLDDCLRAYIADRGEKLVESLQALPLSSYLCYQTAEAINVVEWACLEEHIAMWAQHFNVFVNALLTPEHRFCQQVFYHVRVDLWKEGFGRMAMEVGLDAFIAFGEAFTQSRREPQKLFKLLDMYECLEKVMPNLRVMFNGGGKICREIQKRVRGLHRAMVRTIAGIFKELKHQVEVQEEGCNRMILHRRGEVLKLVSYMVNYFKYMLGDGYKPLISRALNTEQAHHSLERMKEMAETDMEEDEGVQHKLLLMAVSEIMQALEKNLTKTAQMLVGVPAYASFFLMNNYSYIYTRCEKSEVGALLGKEWVQNQLDKMELCAMQYKQETWGQLIAIVNCEGVSTAFSNVISSGTSAGRELIRQRARAFQVALENLAERHSTWFIPYDILRQSITHDVLQSVVPAYRSFLQKHSHFLSGDGSINDDEEVIGHGCTELDPLIIKYTPEAVESMLKSIFDMQYQPHLHISNVARRKTHADSDDDKASAPSLTSAPTSDYDSDEHVNMKSKKTSKKFRLKLSRLSHGIVSR